MSFQKFLRILQPLNTILVTRQTKFKLLRCQALQVANRCGGHSFGLLIDVVVVIVLHPLVDGIRVFEILNIAFPVYATCIDFDCVRSLKQTTLRI